MTQATTTGTSEEFLASMETIAEAGARVANALQEVTDLFTCGMHLPPGGPALLLDAAAHMAQASRALRTLDHAFVAERKAARSETQ